MTPNLSSSLKLFTIVPGNQNPFYALVALTIGLISILLFVPVFPVMPRLGLDPSWILAVNEAAAQGLSFGTEILYTVGPFSSIWSQAYHPETIQLTIMGGSLIAVGHAFLAYRISRASHWLWFCAYALFLVFLMESRDALFLIYPVLMIFYIYRVSLPPSHHDRIEFTRGDSIFLVLAGSSLGLLPIIKLSFVPCTLVACVVGSVLLWRSRHKLVAVSMLVLPAASMLLLWVVAGQDISVLPDYFINNAAIVSGFTQAMSNPYNFHSFLPLVLFVFSSLLILYFFYIQLVIGINFEGLLLWIAIAVFIFLSFKAGFVRHDVHALTASSCIVIAALLLGVLRAVDYRHVAIAILIASITWSVMHSRYSATSFEYYKPLSNRLLTMLKDSFIGNDAQMSHQEQYYAHLKEIRKRFPVPELNGQVDIYPYELSALIASSNKWSPRPVFQSFSAYTPSLAAANANHLSGAKAPDNIIFGLGTIDNRYPSMDDGASWPALLANYDISEAREQFLILSRKPTSEQVMTPFFSKQALLGESVEVGIQQGIIYAKIEVLPSLLGKIMNFLYKPTALQLSVQLSNGEMKTHRFIPGQAVSGFVLSPYIDSLNDFSSLWERPEAAAESRGVDSFRIDENAFFIGMWATNYSVQLYHLKRPDDAFGGVTKK